MEGCGLVDVSLGRDAYYGEGEVRVEVLEEALYLFCLDEGEFRFSCTERKDCVCDGHVERGSR